MIFFGWGKKTRTWPIDEERTLVAVWRYFDIFWLFPIAGSIHWYIVTDNRSEDTEINYERVRQYFPTNTPKVGIWWRFGLLIMIAIFVAWGAIGSLVGTVLGN